MERIVLILPPVSTTIARKSRRQRLLTAATLSHGSAQGVEEMALKPEERKFSNNKTPGIVSPALSYRMVAGARLGAIHERLENWKVEVWDLPTKGRRKDLGRAAADKRSTRDAVATIVTNVSGDTPSTPHAPADSRKNPIQSRT